MSVSVFWCTRYLSVTLSQGCVCVCVLCVCVCILYIIYTYNIPRIHRMMPMGDSVPWCDKWSRPFVLYGLYGKSCEDEPWTSSVFQMGWAGRYIHTPTHTLARAHTHQHTHTHTHTNTHTHTCIYAPALPSPHQSGGLQRPARAAAIVSLEMCWLLVRAEYHSSHLYIVWMLFYNSIYYYHHKKKW